MNTETDLSSIDITEDGVIRLRLHDKAIMKRVSKKMSQMFEEVIDIGVIDEEECKQYTTPKPNSHKPVVDLVMEDLEKRKAFGIKKYGTPLQPFNGRSAEQDLYEELLDAVCYAKQMLLEMKLKRAQT